MAKTKEERSAYMRKWNREWRIKNPEKARAESRRKARLWRSRHPESHKLINHAWRERNKERALLQEKNSKAKSLYGLSSYAEVCELRKRPCGICGLHRERMHIDHDHLTRKAYRGVLCESCNIRLGWFEKRKQAILSYLEQQTWMS